jgi:hypothetical protein
MTIAKDTSTYKANRLSVAPMLDGIFFWFKVLIFNGGF